ncbi:type III-B CRISPR-associated protein Cas10/Cmr2 [Bacteroidales bacterium]|nr:type III-B CRISPR-associated protein Cas10/Cmr2 [Bacteroidales bacterium]
MNKMKINKKYIGITIGPIYKTLSMASKPRQLWSASYLFSYLMRTLVEKFPSEKICILSPLVSKDESRKYGLYPDRLFAHVENEISIEDVIKDTKTEFAEKFGPIDFKYFSIYSAEIEAEDEAAAIRELNGILDALELHQLALLDSQEKSIRELIFKRYDSPLFQIAFGEGTFHIESLSQISSAQLEQINKTKYSGVIDSENRKNEKLKKESIAAKNVEREGEYKKSLILKKDRIGDEDDLLIKSLKKEFGEEFKTYHKYVCIVHADGDNMGKIFNDIDKVKHVDGIESSQRELIRTLSCRLAGFAEESCKLIEAFKGLPIYAGGDDLVFIAPVVSNDILGNPQTIFDLVKTLDDKFNSLGFNNYFICKDGEKNTLSMSYGIAISYYKYPLSEALEMSRNLLFNTAKKVKNKNAIAWNLMKHSGSVVSGQYSKSDVGFVAAFNNLLENIDAGVLKQNYVSAVAHKISCSNTILDIIKTASESLPTEEDRLSVLKLRLDAFFEKTLEYTSKNAAGKRYLDAVHALLMHLLQSEEKIEEITSNVYAILRTSKFIKGLEEDHDE